MTLTILALGLYATGLAVLIFWKRNTETADEFIIAGRALSWKQIGFSSFATLISSYNIVVAVTFAAIFGFYLFLAFAGVALAYILLYFLAQQLRANVHNVQLSTIADYFALRFGPVVGAVSNVAFLLSLFFFLVLQLSVNTSVFTAVLPFNQYIVGGVVAFIVLGYILFGGFQTVVRTDVLQGMLMLLVFLLLFFTDFSTITAGNLAGLLADKQMLVGALALMIVQGLSLSAQPELWQRVYAARSARDLRLGFIFSFILLLLFLTPLVLIGMSARFAGIEPSDAFFSLLASMPGWAGALAAVGIFAAFMSTLDSTLFAMASQLSKGLVPGKIEPRTQIRRIRLWLILVLAVAVFVSFTAGDYLSVVFWIISLVSVVSTVWFIALWWNATNTEVLIGLLVGFAAFAYTNFTGIVVAGDFVSALYPAAFVAIFVLVQRLVVLTYRYLW